MTRKKDIDTILSPENEEQVQRLLEQFHQVVYELHNSTNANQAETALTEINRIPEAVQMALVKALSKEHTTDAADVLLALHELSPNKNVRKEARRSLIRLEGARIYPRWNPPVAQTPVFQPATYPPRFWKGFVTQRREEGEVQLLLCWEQGTDYREARLLSLLLDFWQEGVKDFTEESGTKRHIETRISQFTMNPGGITTVDCTLAEGRRLLQEALSVNAWRGTTPHKEYRHYLPTVRQLVLEAQDPGEDRGRTFIDPAMQPDEVAATFVSAWSLGDYGLCYDLLTTTSDIGEGLPRGEWIERRRAWFNEAHPTRFDLTFVREREQQQSALWLPASMTSRGGSRKEVEIGWSLELTDTPLSGTLKEMAMGTAVNKETGRHWFWTSYTLVQEQNEWRIQSIKDEGANAQGLSIEELQRRIKEHDDRVLEIVQRTQTGIPVDERRKLLEEIFWRMTQAMHYDDALIVKLPLDRKVYENAYNHAKAINAAERNTVYLERMARQFVERRGDTLRELAITQATIGANYEEQGMNERGARFVHLAEENFRKALATDNATLTYPLLAELLTRHNHDDKSRIDEAEALLQQARTLSPNRPEETLIESGLGNITLYRDQFEEALLHFQKAAALSPDYPGVWYTIGHLQLSLGRSIEAVDSLRRSIEETPGDLRAHTELANIYLRQKQYTNAREVLEQGLRNNPNSAYLRALLASVYLEEGDRRHAEALLDEAERINPELEVVQAMREALNQSRKR